MAGQRGSVLVISYLLTTVMVVWTAMTLQQGIVELNAGERQVNRLQGFHLAEAALDQAVSQMSTGATASIGTTQAGPGSYAATIAPVAGTANTYLVQAYGAISGEPDQAIEATVRMTPAPPFRWGLYGIDSVEVRGSLWADSYDSSQGSYAQTHQANGDIGTSAIRANSILVGGAAVVNGDLWCGPGGNPESAIRIRGAAIVSGTRQAAPQPVSFPAIEIPEGVESSGRLRLNADEELVLDEGVYVFESIRAEARSSIVTTGPVTIYVTGSVDFRGQAMVGADNQPSSLQINVLDGNPNVDIAGGSLFVGTIYAPNSSVVVRGNAEVYGSIVGRAVRFEGSGTVHYDEALPGGGSGSQSFDTDVLSWRLP